MALFSKSNDESKGKVSKDIQETGGIARRSAGFGARLLGEGPKRTLQPYLPQELVGGSIPHIPGSEDEAVWNAASQSCSTEKVHYCYTVEGKRIWYLACPSSALSSAPDSWCPLAAALPGNSEYWDKETVYIYEQEGLGSALRWDPETGRLQVFIGASRTLLPRIQSMDGNFVTINTETAQPVSWRNRQLNSERLARSGAKLLLLIGIGLNLLIFSILAFQFILANTLERDLSVAREETERASSQLMISAYDALQSDVIRHFVRVQQLLDELGPINGTLVKYDVNGQTVVWEAYVPQAYGRGVGTVQGEVLPGIAPDGRVKIRGNK